MDWRFLLFAGVLLVGSSGKIVNGPWLISRLNPFSGNSVEAPNGLSPVIFGEILFLHCRRSSSSLSRVTHEFLPVPGDGGSQVDAKLNKPSTVHVICDKTTKDWFNLWLNLELLAPFIIDCWTDNAKLHYNNETRTTSNSPGVEIRIPGWGTPEVVEWIDPSQAVSNLTQICRAVFN
jgi:hypothetical protein